MRQNGKVFVEDCAITLKRDIQYDYVLASPPDFSELGVQPDDESYAKFLSTWVPLLSPQHRLVSVCVSDRKSDGRVFSKHINVIEAMKANGWTLKTHKIWVKTLRANLYRLSYMHLMSFSISGAKPKRTKKYKPDVFMYDQSVAHYKGFRHGMPVSICEMLIHEHTEEGDIVYDPFMGSGTTAVACLNTNRNYLGSEIDEETHKLFLYRIKEAKRSLIVRAMETKK